MVILRDLQSPPLLMRGEVAFEPARRELRANTPVLNDAAAAGRPEKACSPCRVRPQQTALGGIFRIAVHSG